MKLKVKKSSIFHDDGKETPYHELYIGYDFDPSIQITVRIYPSNTHLVVVTDEGKVLIKEDNYTFDFPLWFTRVIKMFDLVFSPAQLTEISNYYQKLENL